MNRPAPMGVLRSGWQAAVDNYAIAGGWTSDGDLLLVGDAAGSVHAFGGRDGRPRWKADQAHEGGVMDAGMNPVSDTFATAGQDGRIILWRSTDGVRLATLSVSRRWVEHIAWSRCGRWLAAASGRSVIVYTVEGEQVWASEEYPSTVSDLAWTAAGELASTCYGRVTFSALPSGKETDRLEWKGSLISLALSADDNIVACGSQDNTVHFWRRGDREDSMMSGYSGKPGALAFDASGSLLATGGGNDVTVWSFADGGPEGTAPGLHELHQGPISTLAFATSGQRLASGGRDGAVVVWDLNRDATGATAGAALATGSVERVYWRRDNRSLAALDAEGGVTAWRVR